MAKKKPWKPAVSLRSIADTERQRAHALTIARGLDETAKLETGRGNPVKRDGGRLRIPSRDGLRTLLESGALEVPEYEAGLAYRRCYEALSGALPCSNGEGGAGGADSHIELRAIRAEQLTLWEGRKSRDRQLWTLTGRQVWVLRLVAGQARTILSLGSSGSAKRMNTLALVEALTLIARERGLRR